MVSGPHMKVTPLNIHSPFSAAMNRSSADVRMTAEVISVDPESRLIYMDWYPRFTQLNCTAEPQIIDIYVPSMFLDTTSPSWTFGPQDRPAFRLNSTQLCFGFPFVSFKTVTKLLATKRYVDQTIWERSSLQNYPFDKYMAPFAFYSQVLGSKAIQGLNVVDSFGVAVNFQVSLLDSILKSDAGVLAGREMLLFDILIERSQATKIFVVMVAITNWLIAIAFLTICAAATVFTDSEIYNEMFVVPVGATFAFTSIRANLPGAPPGFGTTIGAILCFSPLDYDWSMLSLFTADIFTTLPVLVIMSLCSFSLLLMTLYRRITGRMAGQKPSNIVYQDNRRHAVFVEECQIVDIIRSETPWTEDRYRTFVQDEEDLESGMGSSK
ncbi:hypothetical protein CPC08DRAFT_768606 [Agrocybe pediades]|nr:hypothetical protein CPC08DRAFT_768606 [Agrocybe pediades]